MSATKWVMSFVLAALWMAAARAQGDVTTVQVLTVGIKPGMNPQFEEFVSAFKEASRRQGLENYWLSAQSISGDPVYRFHINLSSWGDLANPGPQLAEAYGEKEAERLMGLLRDSVAHEHVAFFDESMSMSNPPPASDAAPEALVYVDFALNPGGAQQWQQMTMKTAEAFRAVRPGYHFVAAMPNFGASGPRTILVMQSMSDLDTPAGPPGVAVIEHFGEQEGARINAMSQSIENFTYSLFRTRPDLNYQPD